MNSFEREVARSQLTAERHTLDELEEIYRQAADEICQKLEISNGKISVLLSEIENADEQTLSVLQSQIYQRNFKQSIKKQLDFLLKDLNDNQYASISEYLENCYNNGFIGTLYNFNMNDIPLNIPIDPTLVVRAIHIESKLSKRLYDELGEDVEVLKRKVSATISRGIASNMHYNDIARNIANNSRTGLNRAMTITRTEGNRIYNAANLDCGKAAKEKGVDDVKQWDSTLDGNTRPHHRQLDGQVRELEEDFEVGSIKAPAPLQFGIPGEDINCRCICLVKPRWDVDSTFTKIDNQTGQLLEFEGTKDYEDFKKRYWKSVKKNSEKSLTYDDDNGKMSVESKIQWHKKGKILTSEQRRELTDYANERNIKLAGLKNTDVDISLMKEVVDDAEKMLAVYPELNSNLQQPFTIKVVNGMSANDFAMTTARKNVNVIQLNANAFRNKEKLAKEYQRLVDEGWFVKGTTYRSIIVHEIGHMYSNVNKVDGLGIAKKVLNTTSVSEVMIKIRSQLSFYSSSFDDGSEILSEVFSAIYSDTENNFAKNFMKFL